MDHLNVQVEEFDNARRVTVSFSPTVEVEEEVEEELDIEPRNYR